MSNNAINDFALKLMQYIGFPSISEPDFNTLALELFSLQFERVAPYRSLCLSRKATPDSVNDWTELPPVPAAAFKEFDLTSIAPESRTAVFYSSGTTASKRSRHYHHRESLRLYETSLRAGFAGAVGDIPHESLDFLSLTPTVKQAPHSSLTHMFTTLIQAGGGGESRFVGRVSPRGEWELDFAEARRRLESAVSRHSPLLVLGTAFSFVHLVDWLQERQLRLALPEGSYLLETGGYKGHSRELPKTALHRSLTSVFDVPAERILCEYGMSELSSQAYDCPRPGHPAGARHFRFPAWARVRIISPETGREVTPGESGLIQILDLANAWSVACIRTQDLGVRHEEGFELLGRSSRSEPRGCSLMAL